MARKMDHRAFGVESEEALVTLREELLKKGVDVTRIISHGICKLLYFYDPNGISPEVSTWAMPLGEMPRELRWGDPNPVRAASDRWPPEKTQA